MMERYLRKHNANNTLKRFEQNLSYRNEKLLVELSGSGLINPGMSRIELRAVFADYCGQNQTPHTVRDFGIMASFYLNFKKLFEVA